MLGKGVDAHEVLTGVTLNVKLGIVGVVNRGPSDENTLDDAKENEQLFFKQNYPDIADKHGVGYLCSLLSNVSFYSLIE